MRESIDDTKEHWTNGEIFTLNSSAMISHVQSQILERLYHDLKKVKMVLILFYILLLNCKLKLQEANQQ